MPVHLSHIDIFPIKSFDALPRREARILPSGCIEHDRRYALFDETGKVVNGKRTPRVHTLETTFNHDCDEVTIGPRDGAPIATYHLRNEIDRANRVFSAHFGVPVFLREDAEAGFPDDALTGGPTVIAAETLRTVADWFQISFDEARARFRANLIVEGGGPFWDDRLYSNPGTTVTFRIGEILLFGTNCCARCAVPTRHPASGTAIRGFVKTFTQARRDHLPPWAARDAFDHDYRLAVNTRLYAPAQGGVIRLGDRVEILK